MFLKKIYLSKIFRKAYNLDLLEVNGCLVFIFRVKNEKISLLDNLICQLCYTIGLLSQNS
jgi:hypothetical protein